MRKSNLVKDLNTKNLAASMMNFNSKSLLLFATLGLLAVSIPGAHAITFDEQTCMSLLSIEQVKSVTGFKEPIIVRTVNGDLTGLNDNLKSGCSIAFEHEDNLQFTLALLAASYVSEEEAREKYSQLVSQSQDMGWQTEIYEENGWDYYITEINQLGLGSALASIKGDYSIGFNTPGENTPIKPSALVELIKIVHANIDGYSQESTHKQVVCPQGMEPVDGKCPDKPVIQSTTEQTMILEKFLSPLEQFKNNVPYSQIECNDNLQLIQKYDGTPACVSHETAFELIKRGWVSDIIVLVQSRITTLDPEDMTSSHMGKIIPTLNDFKNVLSEPYDIDTIFSKFGDPHYDVGHGINVYVYDLNDGTQMMIGYNGDILYITNLDLDGNVLEELFVK